MSPGPCRSLSREEILRLQLMGKITPVSRIPEARSKSRACVPTSWERA